MHKRVRKKFGTLLVFVFSCALLSPLTAFSLSDAAPFDSPREILSFANHLMNEKDYKRALHEYARCLNRKIPYSRLLPLHTNILICLAKSGDRIAVKKELSTLLKYRHKLGITPGDWLRFGHILEREKDYYNAAYAYHIYSKTASNPDNIVCASLLEAKMYFLVGNEEKADRILKKIEQKQLDTTSYREVISVMESRDSLHRKKPKTAMFLSAILPGSGHVYAGATFHGISSFILNAGLISASYLSFKNKSPVLGSFIGYLETGLYLGGIKTAGEDARRSNARKRRVFLKKLTDVLPVEAGFCLDRRFRGIRVVYRF